MEDNKILKVENGVVRLCDMTGNYSIGLRTDKGMEFKFISKELYDLLIKELSKQKGMC